MNEQAPIQNDYGKVEIQGCQESPKLATAHLPTILRAYKCICMNDNSAFIGQDSLTERRNKIDVMKQTLTYEFHICHSKEYDWVIYLYICLLIYSSIDLEVSWSPGCGLHI